MTSKGDCQMLRDLCEVARYGKGANEGAFKLAQAWLQVRHCDEPFRSKAREVLKEETMQRIVCQLDYGLVTFLEAFAKAFRRISAMGSSAANPRALQILQKVLSFEEQYGNGNYTLPELYRDYVKSTGDQISQSDFAATCRNQLGLSIRKGKPGRPRRKKTKDGRGTPS